MRLSVILSGALLAATASAQIRINEVCATTTALDPYGKKSDWVELHNTTANPINLQGWVLSSTKGSTLTFPATNILAGAYLVVYCNKDDYATPQATPGLPLIAPFNISAKGAADAPTITLKNAAATIIDRITLPVQAMDTDTSFGPVSPGYTELPLIATATPYRYHIPSDDALGTNWVDTAFDPAAWSTGNGILTAAGGFSLEPPGCAAWFDFTDPAAAMANAGSSATTGSLIGSGASWLASADARTGVLNFSGNTAKNTRFQIEANGDLNMGNSVITMSFWFRHPAMSSGNGRVLMDCRPSNTPPYNGAIIVLNTNGKLQVQARNAAKGESINANGSSVLSDNAWHHVAVVFEQRRGGTIACYVDGKSEMLIENTDSGWTFQTTAPICFGGAWDSSNWTAFTGMLDDIRLYPRALAATEIALIAGDTLSDRLVSAHIASASGLINHTPSGTAFNATLNGPTYTAGDLPALTFAGTTLDHTAIIPTANARFKTAKQTATLWVKTLNDAPDRSGRSACLIDARANSSGYILGLATSGCVILQAVSGNTSGSTNIADGQWHHVAAVTDRDAATVAIYIDGMLEASASGIAIRQQPDTFYLGSTRDTNWWRIFKGSIGPVGIYSDTLTQSEIIRIHNRETPGTPISLIGTSTLPYDTEALLPSDQNTLYGRTAFTLEAPSSLLYATLNLAFADGLTLWLNGIEILSANMPEFLDNTASATETRPPTESNLIHIPAAYFLAGQNTLAWQAARAVNSPNPLYLDLTLTARNATQGATHYGIMPATTPGEENDLTGAILIGPAVSNVTHTPGIALAGQPLLVTATISDNPNAAATSSAALIYRAAFGAEKTVGMILSSGVWRASIPAEDLPSAGGLIRYRFVVTDTAGDHWRDPAFADPFNSPEYYGTIVDPGIDSPLPLYHIFADSVNLANMDKQFDSISATTEGMGARCGIFHAGRFYDNVRIDLRGNTTASFPKKSHSMRFNKGHGLIHDASGKTIRRSSFVAEYADPSYLRQALAFWVLRQAGMQTPFHYPVQLQRNGQFYQLAFHSHRMTDELVKHFGWDPLGDLYKCAGQITTGYASTGGFEKKAPEEWVPGQPNAATINANYLNLASKIAAAVPAATRAINAHDLLDIPSFINYLAATRITQECDDVWANLCIYFDTHGDRIWRPVPYDFNLTFGQHYGNTTDGERATDDTYKSHPNYGGQATAGASFNRIFDAIYTNPTLRSMQLRRLRTLMDELLKEPGTDPSATPLGHYIFTLTNAMESVAIQDRATWGTQTGVVIWNWGGTTFTPAQGTASLWNNYIIPRRTHLYVTHSITNTAGGTLGYGSITNRAGIPEAQPQKLPLTFGPMDPSPASGNQEEEYLTLQNPHEIAVDISNWVISGDISHTLQPGTVIPAGGTLYLTPNRPAFPKAGQGLFVQGNYTGKLGTRPSTLTLTDTTGFIAASTTLPDNQSDPQRYLRISEFMYAPPDSIGGDAEYIELINISTDTPLDLTGVSFSKGITYTFPTGQILAPGARFLIAKNSTLVKTLTGSTANDTFTGSLDNAGEDLRIIDSRGEKILDVSYKPGWYPATLKLGSALIATDPITWPHNQFDKKAAWYPSATLLALPKPANQATGTVIISELLAHTDPPQVDTIELYNTGKDPVDIGGWYLSDSTANPTKFRIPDATILQPGAYITFEFPEDSPYFALSANGEDAVLSAADASGTLTGYRDSFSFGPTPNGISIAPLTTSDGKTHYPLRTAFTPGARNAPPIIGPIIISAIHANPGTAQEYPYIELINISATPIGFGRTHPQHPERGIFPCQLNGDITFTFPTDKTLQPGERAIVVSFDPGSAANAARFRARYGVPESTLLLGPWLGTLTGNVTFTYPDNPNIPDADHPDHWAPQITSDPITFKPAIPQGQTLRRRSWTAFANEPRNWILSTYTPGLTPPLREGLTLLLY